MNVCGRTLGVGNAPDHINRDGNEVVKTSCAIAKILLLVPVPWIYLLVALKISSATLAQ